jgi:hypothetical protein
LTKALFGNPIWVCTVQCDCTVQLDKFDRIILKNTSHAMKIRFYPYFFGFPSARFVQRLFSMVFLKHGSFSMLLHKSILSAFVQHPVLRHCSVPCSAPSAPDSSSLAVVFNVKEQLWA